MPNDDLTLLREYARNNSEAAFSELVLRHINLVYSVTLRSVNDAHLAEEITQTVFIILARKADKLSQHTVLPGWLCRTARYASANALTIQRRRQHREQEAYMQNILAGGSDASSPQVQEETWNQIAPLLDGAMEQLGQKDHDALVLRFFEGRNYREVGMVLGTGEDAAKMRVNRALEKLRKFFTKRGISSTSAILAGAMSAHSVQAAPVALAKSVTAVAIAKGSIAAASTLTLVKGTMKTIAWLKIKFVLGVAAATLLIGGAAIVAVSQDASGDKLTPQEIAKESLDIYHSLTSYSDTGKVETIGGGSSTETTFSIRLQRPFLYRIEWTQTGGSYTSKGIVWSDGSGDYFVMDAANKIETAKSEKMHSMQMALASASGVSGSAAASIPGAFFEQNWGDQLDVFLSSNAKVQKLPDDQIGGTDCHVIESRLDSIVLPNDTGNSGKVTTRLWIGKLDHFIHQIRTTSDGATVKIQFKDEDLKIILERQDRPATPEEIADLRAQLEKSTKAAQGGKIVFMQTHENISVNEKFSSSDFSR